MQGVGNTKEAGTKAWGRPFWTMLQGLSLTLPLGGCLLTGDKPEPALDIPPVYRPGPRNPRCGGSGSTAARLVALLPLARTDRNHRRGPRRQSRYRRRGRAHRAGRCEARIAGAALLPIIDFNGNAMHSQQSKTTGSSSVINVSRSGASVAIINNNLSATLNASYEIDFWGKNRSLVRAAEETAVASRYDREVVGLTTVVAAANAYFQVLAAQDRLRVARENMASADSHAQSDPAAVAGRHCVRARHVAQQESLVNTQRAAIPPLEQTLASKPGDACTAHGATARKRGQDPRREPAQHCLSARHTGPAVRTAHSASRHPRSRGAISPPPTPMSKTRARNSCLASC